MRLTRVCCKYFEKFVEYEMRKNTGYDVKKPLYGWIRVGKKRWKYDENHPLTNQAMMKNYQIKHECPRTLKEPIKEWKIFKGDRVKF